MTQGGDWAGFEYSVLRRALDDVEVMEWAAAVLGATDFTDAGAGWLWNRMALDHASTGERLDLDALEAEIRALPEEAQGKELAQHGINKIREASPAARFRSLARAIQARARKINAMRAIQRAVTSFDKGKDETAFQALERAIASTKTEGAPVPVAKPLIPASYADLMRHSKDRGGRIPTGLFALDRAIDGLAKKEVGLLIGGTGKGKSAVCVNMGYAAIKHQRRVLYLDTENGEEITTMRFISRFTQIPYRALENDALDRGQRAILDSWLGVNRGWLADQLRVIYLDYMEVTWKELGAAIGRTVQRGFAPDMIIMDSPDHLLLPDNRTARWEQFAELANGIKALAQKHNVAFWGTSQISGDYEDKIATTQAIADSKQKGRNASLVISVNMVPKRRNGGAPEGEEGGDGFEPRNQRRRPKPSENVEEYDMSMYVAKARNRRARFLVPLVPDLSRMTIKAPPGGLDTAE